MPMRRALLLASLCLGLGSSCVKGGSDDDDDDDEPSESDGGAADDSGISGDGGGDAGGDDGGGDAGGDDGGDDPPADCDGSVSGGSWSSVSDNGVIEFTADLGASDGMAFLITGRARNSDYTVMLAEAREPVGTKVIDWEDWQSTDELLSYAVYPLGQECNFNWPIRDNDYPFEPGTWSFTYYVLDSDYDWADNVTVDFEGWLKSDTQASKGCVKARIVLADGIGDDDELMEAIQGAVQVWKETWAQVGVSLIIDEWVESDLDPVVEEPSEGSDEYAELTAGNDGDIITLVIGESVGTDATSAYRLGQAGGLPGALGGGPNSVVAVGWLLHAGGNATFSDGEINVFGTTMAHEGGHFLGLLHSVQYDADYEIAYFDALDDTPTCSSWSQCENLMGDNLMYPYAVCNGTTCIQNEVTDDQGGVLQRYTGTL